MKKRLLIFSQRFPPGIGGTPTVMGNLCSALPKESIHVTSLAERGELLETVTKTDYPQTRLPHPSKLRRKLDSTFLSLIPNVVRTPPRYDGRDAGILAVYPATSFMLAAYYYARKQKLPFYPYFMDTWEEGRSRKLERALATRYEPRVFSAAEKIFVLTPALKDFFSNKYPKFEGKICVLPHSIKAPDEQPNADPKWRHDGLHIVYTGQVYGPTVDPIHLLLESFKGIKELNPKLTISTPDSLFSLNSYGLVDHPRVQIVRLDSEEEVASLQASADILFNPVSFERQERLQVKTLFPTKTIEYLRARRPMLVCGPSSTEFVKYATDKGFGYVVDKDDPELLAASCSKIFKTCPSPQIEAARENELLRRDSIIVAKKLLDEINMKSI